MRDSSLLIVIIGAVLVSICSSTPQSFRRSAEDEHVRMASESLVVKSYKEAESSTASTTKSHAERFEEYQVYQGVMGRPGIDFPVYPHIPATSFSCRGVKKSGYYADLETDCQVFHICDGNRKISFLCPNGTIFRQSHLICDWWFRVDCGKSVELYEESAEQLAADQKVYRARSEEREKRRKLGKTAAETGGELTSSEVYALDEPFHLKTRKSESNRNQFQQSGRNSFENRKAERHSKKVTDSNATEKFPSYNRSKQNGRGSSTARTSTTVDYRQYSTAAPVNQGTPKVSFVESSVTPSSSKVRYQAQNSISTGSNKENIQPAESGSFVEDLNNRNSNFAYNSTSQTFEYNTQNRNRGTQNFQNAEVNQHRNSATYNSQKTEVDQIRINNGASNIQTSDVNLSRNNNAAYSSQNSNTRNNNAANYNSQSIEVNNNAAYSSQNIKERNNNAANYNSQNFETNKIRNNNVAYKAENTGVNLSQNTNAVTSSQYTNNLEYNNQINQTAQLDFVNGQNQQYQAVNTQSESNGFVYDNQKNDDSSNRNINFNKRTEQTGRNTYAFNDQKPAQENTFETTKIAEDSTDIGVTAHTTEFFNYESKRTNPVERQETVTPTLQTIRNSQSSRYRSSTQAYIEQEKQFFAESASFASHRGGKSFSDFQNQFNTFDKKPVTSTPSSYQTTFYTTTKRVEGFSTTPSPLVQKQSTANFNFNQDFFRSTTYRPVKQHSKKVTIYPSTNPQTTFANRNWQTTTFQPYYETTANEKFTVNDIYFTTSTPDKPVEFITENFGLSPKEADISYEVPSTSKQELDISLQELNINKTPQPIVYQNFNKTYEDFVREGLEVPPSSGPNAIRSFALYFATTNNNLEEGKTTAFLPTIEPDLVTTLTPYELKKKEVVKQVDELVQRSSANASEHVSLTKELPNSLTPNTQNSYSALFPAQEVENYTSESVANENPTENFETTAFESFTEEPFRINKELTKNDLDGSQSRGLVEPDPNSDTDYSKVSPDLRELAQVFTKALSAYLDDPEAFRRVLSEIRPTEPTVNSEVASSNPLEYPSATQEDDEVLDFSDVTKSSYRKKTSTASVREVTTEYFTEPPTTTRNDIENFVLPVNQSSWATNVELTAPLLETLDQSQSSYYTAPPYIGTTNAIAEEINNGFTPSVNQNEAVDSYLPIKGSVDDQSLPRYGGFQNNTNPTTKYSPYGAELTSTTYLPYGADLTSTSISNTEITTFNPNNVTSFFSHFSSNESEEGEIQLAKELNNLVLLQKFTTPRGNQRDVTTQEPNLSTVHLVSQNDINQYQEVKLGNGEILEKSVRGGKSLHFPESTITSNEFEPDVKEINLELSPPPSTPKGFLITYSIGASSSSEPATYLPKATTPVVQPTTYYPTRQTTTTFIPETQPPTANPAFENYSERLERLTKIKTSTEYYTTPSAPTTVSFSKSTKSIDRLAQLQETLMFNSSDLTIQQRHQARFSVEDMMDKMNMTDSTANALMKVMEMAAKNETYRRLVLLLVNDKSGKNKTVEESRLSLLKALLTPVINPPKTVVPISETSKLVPAEGKRRNGARRSKSINSDNVVNAVTTPSSTTTQRRPSSERKPSRGLTRAESNYNSGLGNLGIIRRTIENSKNKQVKINSIDDAILDSDSRAVDLLRSLYSLAARWG